MSDDGIRLQKVLASAGVGSRRVSENYIAAGRVSVNGAIVTELGTRVDPETVVIHVDGRRLLLNSSTVTIALHKPAGVISAMSDPEGRPCLDQFVADRQERLFHVGRLDYDSEGLLLLTNDGELAHRLAHPSYEVAKTYVVTVRGRVNQGLPGRLRRGLELEDGPIAVDSAKILATRKSESIVQVTLHSGRNRIVRRIFDAVDHPVTRLIRTSVGPILLGELPIGAVRELTHRENEELVTVVGL